MKGKRVKFFSNLLKKSVSGIVIKENKSTVVLELKTRLQRKCVRVPVNTPNLHCVEPTEEKPNKHYNKKLAAHAKKELPKRYDKRCTYSQKNDKTYITIKKSRLI